MSATEATPMNHPNIVLVQADQLAAAALGAYGNSVVQSPHIDALAQEGVVFDRAYCNSPLCAPSRASMMTGRLPSNVGVYDNAADFSSSVPTFAHHLRSLGYHTALVGRMHFIGADQLHGFESRVTSDVYPADMSMVPDWTSPERQRWFHDTTSVFSAGASVATVQQDFDDEVIFQSLRHLNDRVRARDGRPFLMVSSFIHPHDPYEPPTEHWHRYDDVEIDMPRIPALAGDALDPHSRRLLRMCGFDEKIPDEDSVRRARRAYYAAVSYVDDHVGRIMKRLEDLDLADNTVVIVTSDHGDMLGERGLWYKMSPFEQSARIPLIVHAPWMLQARRVDRTVSLVDLVSTLVDLAGGDPSAVRGDGASLVPLATGLPDVDWEDEVVIEYLAEGVELPQITLVRGTLKYVHCPTDPDQLYDVAADPDELDNLAGDRAWAETVATMRAEVEGRYDLAALADRVLASQRERRVVRAALATGELTDWDHAPRDDSARRYVRGDFWSALQSGRVPATPAGVDQKIADPETIA